MAPAAGVALADHVSARAPNPGTIAGTVGRVARSAPARGGLPDRGLRASDARTTGLGDRLGDGVTWRGQRVDLSAIHDTALLTVEGAEDDMCSPGQTEAAHRLCSGVPAQDKRHHLQPGVGHYGVFAGTRWDEEIYPVIRTFIADRGAPRPTPVRA